MERVHQIDPERNTAGCKHQHWHERTEQTLVTYFLSTLRHFFSQLSPAGLLLSSSAHHFFASPNFNSGKKMALAPSRGQNGTRLLVVLKGQSGFTCCSPGYRVLGSNAAVSAREERSSKGQLTEIGWSPGSRIMLMMFKFLFDLLRLVSLCWTLPDNVHLLLGDMAKKKTQKTSQYISYFWSAQYNCDIDINNIKKQQSNYQEYSESIPLPSNLRNLIAKSIKSCPIRLYNVLDVNMLTK